MTKQTPLVGKAAMAWWARVSYSTTLNERAIKTACREQFDAQPQKIRAWRNRKGWYKVVMDEEITLNASVSLAPGGTVRTVKMYLTDDYGGPREPVVSLEDLGRMLERRGPAPGLIRRAVPYIFFGVVAIGLLVVVWGMAIAYWPR